jgi:hypothetical protein
MSSATATRSLQLRSQMALHSTASLRDHGPKVPKCIMIEDLSPSAGWYSRFKPPLTNLGAVRPYTTETSIHHPQELARGPADGTGIFPVCDCHVKRGTPSPLHLFELKGRKWTKDVPGPVHLPLHPVTPQPCYFRPQHKQPQVAELSRPPHLPNNPNNWCHRNGMVADYCSVVAQQVSYLYNLRQ